MEDNDAQLQLKKRARRRLIGAVFFVSLVALLLPMIMDDVPRQVVQDVEIRIPGQDDKPFAPKFAMVPPEKAADSTVTEDKAPVAAVPTPTVAAPATAQAAGKPTARVIDTGKEVSAANKPKEKVPEKAPEKAAEKARVPEKPVEKPVEKSEERARAEEARRAAAILGGQGDSKAEAKPAAKSGEHLVLIGAFANEENVRIIKTKLGEMGIRTYTEALDTPQGRKTRVRAGPFPNKEAAEKALEKMKRIGVSGTVAAR